MPRIRRSPLFPLVVLALPLAACQDGGAIQADNANPTIDITSPQRDSTFSETEEIVVRGTVADREDRPDALQVDVILGNGDPVTVEPDAAGDWRWVLGVQAPGTYTLEARARDTLAGVGTASVTFLVEAVNRAPEVSITAPENGASIDEGVTLALNGQVSDDGPLDALLVQWSSSIDGVIAESLPDLDGNVQAATRSLTPGVHQIRLIAEDAAGERGRAEVSVVVVDVNAPPADPDIEVSPLKPRTTDDINLTLLNEGQDPDGDEVSYTIRWYLNGDLQADLNNKRKVPADRTTRDEVWKVEVTGADPAGLESATVDATVTVVNSLPMLQSAVLAPSVAYKSSTLSVILSGGSDADGDTLTYRYAWTVNGAEVDGYSGSTLDGAYFRRGDEIRALVTPFDGVATGGTVSTAPVVIQDDLARGLEVEIVPSAPVITDDLFCDIVAPATDADGDSVSYRYTWLRDGVTVYDAEVGRDTIEAREIDLGETWACVVTPFSGGVPGETSTDQVVIRAGVGSVVVTEVMARPAAASGEYIELYNAADIAVDLSGWVLRDDGSDRFVISPSQPLFLSSGAYLVIGASADPALNGGADVDLVWSGFSLNDATDDVVIEADGEVVDRMRYGSAVGIVPRVGAALNLDVDAYDSAANDVAESWCRATTPLAADSFGTPGALNDLCACAWSDADGDGWGSDDAACGIVDCDDTLPASNPGAAEVCEDGVDNDCDGQDDLCDCSASDDDLDGFGDVLGCPADERDCDDDNPETYPGAPELCDDADNDCDNTADDGLDRDGDGARVCPVEGDDEDCDDRDADTYPGAAEVCDGKDNNCNGTLDDGFDVDRDGYTSCGGDCNDNNNQMSPGVAEICEDGIDNNCSGLDESCACAATDTDGDGFGGGTACPVEIRDCDDVNPNTYPQAPERCDDFDNDCDGVADEGLDVDGDGFESCAPVPDCDDGSAAVFPGAVEVCNDVDDDCDGDSDEGFDNDNDGFTTCGGALFPDCNDLNPLINPAAHEFCDNKDNDCDGLVDDEIEDAYEDNDLKDSAYDLGLVPKLVTLRVTFDRPGDLDYFVMRTSEFGLAGSYLRLEAADIAVEAEMWNNAFPDLLYLSVDAYPGETPDQSGFPGFPGIPQGGTWYLKVKAKNPAAVSCQEAIVTIVMN